MSTASHIPQGKILNNLPERLNGITEVLRREYCRKHLHPWVVAYSGGKDSTLLLQSIWEMVANLPPDRRHREIIVVGNDTLVESPLIIRHLRRTLTTIGEAASTQNLPINVQITVPAIDQTFWVNVIGRGYIPPTRNFRWCTDRMKILPTSRMLRDLVSEYQGVILLIGTRRSESQNRQRGMDRRNVSAIRLNLMTPYRAARFLLRLPIWMMTMYGWC